ncbi:MAG: TonB-dependent receptor [Gemmatimonadetes bacterium]|nr:TonB-dependent receptor [Gemmatimonadota bacterium]
MTVLGRPGRLHITLKQLIGMVPVLLTLVAGAVEAQSRSATVQGRVTAEGAAALAGVSVEMVGADRRAVSDNLGRFRFSDVRPGSYSLRFSLIGRTVLERQIEVDGPGVHEVEIELDKAPVGLEPLLVLLDRTRLTGGGHATAEIAGSAHVIGEQELEDRKQLFDDVHQLLRSVPGVHVQEEDGYGLRPNIGMRGAGSDRSAKITVMEDGVLAAPAPYAAPAAYYFPVAGRMEAIEVRKGSSQVRHGPFTVGGAVNLVSSSIPSDLSVLVDAAGGESGSKKVRARVGDSGTHFGWLLETYQLRTDGFKRLDGGGSTGFDLRDYVAKARVTTSLDARVYQDLQFKAGYYDESSDETYLGLTSEDFEVTPLRRYSASQKDRMKADQRQLQVRHFLRFGTVDVTTTAYRNDVTRNWYKLQSVNGRSIAAVLSDPAADAAALAVLRGTDSDEGALRVRANNRAYEARGIQTSVGLTTSALGGHALELGARFHQDEEDRFQHEDAFTMSTGAMQLSAAGGAGTQANRVSRADAWSFFVQDRMEFGRLTLSPGVRYETIDFVREDYASGDATRSAPSGVRTNDVSVWIPGLGASWQAGSGLRLFGGVHRGFAPPGPGADQETRPERSVNYEAGTRLNRARLAVQAVGFFSDYTNILGAETLAGGTDGSGDLFNGGAVHAWGGEFSADYEMQPGNGVWRVPVHAAYTFTRATFRSDFESSYEPWGSVSSGDELPYIPTHQLYVRSGVERGPFSGSLTANYTSAMRTAAGSGALDTEQSTDAAFVLGLGAEYRVASRLAVYGGVQNLTDAMYVVARRPAGLRPGLPRTVQIGLRLTH